MPSYSNRLKLKSDFYPAIKYNYKKEIPIQFEYEYFQRLNYLVSYHKDLLSAVIPSDKSLQFPLNTDFLQKYLSGFRINYTPFDNSFNPKLEGYYEKDPSNENVFNVYYNANSSYKKQRYTQTHETIHICQSLDPFFQTYFDELIVSQTLPNKLIIKLLEKATDKATAMYLMPQDYFHNKYRESSNVNELADYFQTSIQSVAYRLKELGLIYIQ